MENNQPPAPDGQQAYGPSPQPANRRPERPWRTEGLPHGEDEEDKSRRPRWLRTAVALLVLYGVVFALFSWQDAAGGVATIPYTAFTEQVQARNVAEVYARGDTIQGTLRQARPVPGQAQATYQKFQTERPTFARDDLLAELQTSGATVRATPVNSDRGPLYNLLISLAPVLLLFGLYYWLFRRYRGQLGGGMGGLFGAGKQQKPVKPEDVRATFADVAGIDEVKAEVSEVVDFLRHPDKYRQVGARAPRDGSAGGAAVQTHGQRGKHRDDRGRPGQR